MFVMNNKWDIRTSPSDDMIVNDDIVGQIRPQLAAELSLDDDDDGQEVFVGNLEVTSPGTDNYDSVNNNPDSNNKVGSDPDDQDEEEEEFDNFNGAIASMNVAHLQPNQSGQNVGGGGGGGQSMVVFDRKLNHFINTISSSKISLIVPKCFDVPMLSIPNLRIMKSNDHTISLQTIIRNKNSARDDFVFNADRLIRLVIEEGLNQLPFNEKEVTTPTGEVYHGVEYLRSNCGVSIVRSGEAMEKGLRDCCRSIRIGKVLIQSDEETHQARVLYAKLPADISLRKVLLLYPIMSTGNTVIKAVKVLMKNGVKEANIILINLFSTPMAIRAVASRFQKLTIQTTEVHPIAPFNFGQKYFGTF